MCFVFCFFSMHSLVGLVLLLNQKVFGDLCCKCADKLLGFSK